MTSSNVKTAIEAYEAFNGGDLDTAMRPFADALVWEDHSRGLTYKTRQELKDAYAELIHAFPDARATEVRVYEAGSTVVIQFVGTGTNAGSFGPFPPTGRSVRVAGCDILHFDSHGRIVGGESYIDTLSVLVQLGYAEAPTAE